MKYRNKNMLCIFEIVHTLIVEFVKEGVIPKMLTVVLIELP